MEYMGVGPNATPEAQQERDLLDELITSQFDTDEEKELARTQLGESMKMNFMSAEPVGSETKQADKAPEADKTPEADAAASADKTPTEDDKAAASTAADDKPVDDKPVVDPALAASQRRIAELEAQVALTNSETDMRNQVSEKMKETLDQQKVEDEAIEAKIVKFTEDFGEDAAGVLRKQVEDSRALREKDNVRMRDDEFAQLKAAKHEELSVGARTEADIAGVPDLNAWKADAVAAYGGDKTRSADRYNVAVSIDQVLRSSPEWGAKSQPERFAEVVRRTKVSMGDVSAEPTAEPTAEEIQTKIAAEIAKQARGGADAPASMTDIGGGTEIQDEMKIERLANMNEHEIASQNIPMARLEAMAARLPGADDQAFLA